MSVRYDPPRPLPPGLRPWYEVTAEIEKAEGLKSTGRHFAFEPRAEDIASAEAHKGCEVVSREIVTGGERSWTLFARLSPDTGSREG